MPESELVSYDEPRGITHGARVALAPGLGEVRPEPGVAWPRHRCDGLRHRWRAAFAEGGWAYPILARGVAAAERRGLGPRQALGVRALDLFAPCSKASDLASSQARASASRPCWR